MFPRFLTVLVLPLGVASCVALTTTQPLPALAGTPTNNAEAFRRFDLYVDRTAAQGIGDHQNISSYPSILDSDRLLAVRGPGDTMCLVRSEPYDGIQMGITNTVPQSYVEYAVSPPQYLTSVAAILMGYSVFNGSGIFNDSGKQLIRVTVHYVDATSTVTNLLVGLHARSWESGQVVCTASNPPYYTAQPSSPLLAVLNPGGSVSYDINELLLPTNKRSIKIDLIRIEALIQDHFCSTFIPHIYSGVRLHGVSTWPSFSITNASSQPVVRQSQFTNVDHGGYTFAGSPVGTRRLMNRTACQVASQAMCYTYTGFNCSPTALNTYLQQNKGYVPDKVAIVTFVAPGGGSIRYTGAGKTAQIVGDRFLVESPTPYANPLATYQVTVAYQAASTNPPRPFIAGQATRVLMHNATVPTTSDVGRVYWKMIPRVADRLTSTGPQLRSIDLYDSPQLAAQVEDLLVQNIAVQLNVPDHFVVASGWTSSFRPDGSARGTYSIKDPFDDRNYTKLIEGKYRNTFTMARYVVPVLLASTPDAVTGGDLPGLAILASGARRIEVIDPLGRHMMRDASTGEGVYEIPDAVIEDVASEHDNGGDVDDPLTGYDIEIPTTVDGHYTITVYSDNGLSMSANGYTSFGVFASDDAVDTTAAPVGGTYDVLYSGFGQTVSVTHTGTIGVNESPVSTPSHLRVRRSPTTGPVEFILGGVTTTDDAIDVFDITGRRVDEVEVPPSEGTRGATWDWRSAGVRPGVYLARQRSRPSEMTRFVVLH